MAPHATSDANDVQLPGRSGDTRISMTGYRSLPIEDACLSYWHRTTRAWLYLDHNEGSPVPSSAKYVIVGSGLAGSLTAWSLVESGVGAEEVLILEAREAVSGASGRNAGHCRPDAFRGFAAYARIHGQEQAKKIVENEKLVFEKLDAFVKLNQVPCDFNSTKTFDVCMTEEFAAYEAESFQAYKAAGGDVSHVQFWEGEEARTRTKVKDAITAYEWPAGSCHPAKLAQWLLSELISKGLQLWTHCPATEITRHQSSNGGARWDVRTPRGTVGAENVVHCTNAYVAHLLPELSTFVTPNRAQAHSFVPSKSLSGKNALTCTMSLRYSLKHFFSFIQRKGDGTVIFGVSRQNPEWSEATKKSIPSFDDTRHNAEVAATAKKTFERLFPPGEVSRHGEGADNYWSGIIAMTSDSVPMVGEVEGKEGQWICAGFSGHGMARLFTCAPGLVKLMRGEAWEATGLPEVFQYSQARLERAERRDNVKSVW